MNDVILFAICCLVQWSVIKRLHDIMGYDVIRFVITLAPAKTSVCDAITLMGSLGGQVNGCQ